MKQFRMLVIGLFAGVMLTVSASAFAAGSVSKIEAYLREGFTFKVNGQVVTLQNTPIVYQDTSYMPVRELATMLGYDVGFEDNTITLDAKQPPAESAAVEQRKDDIQMTTVTDPVDLDPWVTLDYAESQGVTITNDGEFISFSFNEKEAKFKVPNEDVIVAIKGGYSIKRENGIIYFGRNALETLLDQ